MRIAFPHTEACKHYHTAAWTWARNAIWFEQKSMQRLLARRSLSAADVVLDVPCGTGILGSTLVPFAPGVIASDISLEMVRLFAHGKSPGSRS